MAVDTAATLTTAPPLPGGGRRPTGPRGRRLHRAASPSRLRPGNRPGDCTGRRGGAHYRGSASSTPERLMPHRAPPAPPGARRRAQRRAARHRLHGDGLGHAGRGPRARPHRGPGQRPGAVGGPGVRLAADLHRPGAGPTAVRRHRRTCPASSRSSPTTSTASSPACSRAVPSSAQVGRSPVGGGDEAVARINDVLTKLETDITAGQGEGRLRRPGRPAGVPRHDHRRRDAARARSARRTRSPTSARPRGCRRPRRRRPTASSSRRRAATRRADSSGCTPIVERVFYRAPRVLRVTAVALLRRRPPAADGRPRGPALRPGPDRALRLRRHRAAVGRAARPRPGPGRRRHLRRGRHRRRAGASPRAARPPCAPRSAATSSVWRRLDPGRGQDGAGGNAARRGRVAGVDARRGSLGRPRASTCCSTRTPRRPIWR